MISDVLYDARLSIRQYMDAAETGYPGPGPLRERLEQLLAEMVSIQAILDAPPGLEPFTCIYEEPGVGGWQFFQCFAENADHAEEQATNAYPDATILWVNQGHGRTSQTMEE